MDEDTDALVVQTGIFDFKYATRDMTCSSITAAPEYDREQHSLSGLLVVSFM